jgi:hypothetical protein
VYSCSDLVRSLASDEYETAGFFRRLRIGLQLIKCKLLCQPKNCWNYRAYLRKLGVACRDAITETPASDSELQAAETRTIEKLSRKL